MTHPIVVQHEKLEELMDQMPSVGVHLYYICHCHYRKSTENLLIKVIVALRWFDNGVIHSHSPYLETLSYHPYLMDNEEIQRVKTAASITLDDALDYIKTNYGVTPLPGLVEIGCEPFGGERWEVRNKPA